MKVEPDLEVLAPAIELRVLIGPQSGSRLELSKGEYTIGSSDDCTIILSGPRIEPCHVKLKFDGEALCIEPVSGKIYDSRGTEITEIFDLMLGSAVEIGGVWICVDNIDELWPDPTTVAALALPVREVNPKTQEDIANAETSIDAIEKSGVVSIGSGKIHYAFFIFFILFISLVSSLLYIGWFPTPEAEQSDLGTEPQSISEIENLKKVRALVASLAPSDTLTVEIDSSHRVFVTGHLPTNFQKNKITQAIENTFPSSRIHIYSDEELFDLASKHIDSKIDHSKIFLKVLSVESGIIFLKGAASSSASRDFFLEKVKSDVKGIKDIKHNILLADDLPKILQIRIAENGLSKKIELSPRESEFFIQGILSDTDLRKFEAILSGFTEEFGNILPIRAAIKLAPAKSPIPVQAILGGSFPLIITNSGEKITRGGSINGQVLINIQDDAAVFEGNSRYKISR